MINPIFDNCSFYNLVNGFRKQVEFMCEDTMYYFVNRKIRIPIYESISVAKLLSYSVEDELKLRQDEEIFAFLLPQLWVILFLQQWR